MSTLVKLICTECGRENYHTYKNKKNHSGRLEFKKYCPFLRKHTVHKEKK
ncbi:50S ribosomal protein L33 [Columbia Basin potato purple top phytoplasma]|uniref:Large ribosomal subunit protein bL33 n=1 Tax=Columbia Basin potato purple top phytoplasma TaxID=307134 RepID=A0ABT5LBY6_9MOLU|nr:50S ribosomal protein L33 [Columbia Basin potato purple top phytoplasma]MDC9032103.1 50S ribosomal protein L33 [Columbia Basin potato purple top phytoplasma]